EGEGRQGNEDRRGGDADRGGHRGRGAAHRAGPDRPGGRRVEDGQGKLVVQVLAILLWPALALAQPGAASGRLEVKGRTIELRHAYASPQPGVFDPASEDIRVLLTDVALAPEARDTPFQIIRL